MASQKKKLPKSILTIFYSLVLAFAVIVGGIFLEPLRPIMRLFPLFGLVIFGLGLALVITTKKKIIKKPLSRWLILTGGSAVGFFAGAILHNLLYAVEILTKAWPIVSRFFGLSHALFFIISIIVCPLGFIVGSAGVIYHFIVNPRG